MNGCKNRIHRVKKTVHIGCYVLFTNMSGVIIMFTDYQNEFKNIKSYKEKLNFQL